MSDYDIGYRDGQASLSDELAGLRVRVGLAEGRLANFMRSPELAKRFAEMTGMPAHDPVEPDVGDGIEAARITVVKTFDDDSPGGFRVWAAWSEGLTLLDALGMLSFAEHSAARDGFDGEAS